MAKYIFDIESYPNYFLGAFLQMDTGEVTKYEHWKSRNSIDKMMTFLDGLDEDDWVITYNGLYYDFVILDRIADGTLSGKEDIYNWGQENIFSRSRDEMRERARLGSFNYTAIDLMELFNLKQSLKKTAAYLHYEKVQDLPIKPGTVVDLAQKKQLSAYCEVDLRATAHLYIKGGAEEEMKGRSFLIEKYDLEPSDITLGRPRIATRAIRSVWQEKWNDYPPAPNWRLTGQDFVFDNLIDPRVNFKTEEGRTIMDDVQGFRRAQDAPTFKRQYEIAGQLYTVAEGGLHDDIGARVYGPQDGKILDIDVSSYYPTLMLNLGLLPRHLKAGGILEMVRSVVDDRLRFKAEGKKAFSDSLKIVINSLYGMMGNKYSFMYDPHMKLAVCLNGQLYLLMLIERLAMVDVQTVYANTDGIIVLARDSREEEKIQAVVKKWSKKFNLGVDLVEWDNIFCLNVNDYVWVKDDEVKGKKTFNTKVAVDSRVSASIVPEAVIYHLTTGKPMEEYMENALLEEDAWKQFVYVVAPTKRYLTNRFDIDGAVGAVANKTIRYYHALDGGTLYKYNENTGGTTKYGGAASVRLFNDVDVQKFERDLDLLPYLAEAEKLLEQLVK